MEVCKLCGKECKNLGSHLRTAHQLTPEKYAEMEIEEKVENELEVEEEFEEIGDTVEEIEEKGFTPEQMRRNRFDGSRVEENPDRPLSDFLNQYGISEKELIQVVKKYKGVGSIDVAYTLKRKSERGKDEAQKINDSYDGNDLNIEDLYVADSLTKEFGFKCKTVKKTGNKKVWILSK